MTKTVEEQQQVDYHRQQVIEKALEVADRVILDGSDGSNEETNFLTARVAAKMVERALHPFHRDILRKDIGI